MLSKLRIQNFRCFRDHSIPFRPCTIIVGRNNAGKSTLVDALRLVSIATTRFRSLAFKAAPEWSDIAAREVGLRPSIEGMDFNTDNLFHRYGHPPAIVTATFTNGNSTRIYIGDYGQLHVVLVACNGSIVKTRAMAPEGFLPRLEILPHVGPVQKSEVVLDRDYVFKNLSSVLAPYHFRNQLNMFVDKFPRLQSLAEQTWRGLRIEELIGAGGRRGEELRLLVRSDDFVSELSTMGHGLQMWLQAMWFLCRVEGRSTVVLDEPDVYMHPDLQMRLIRHLKRSHSQVIVATHSVEIMAETGADDLLVIDRRRDESKFATSMPAAQRVLEHLGSAQNIQLAKLWHARRCLLVEGKDFGYLSEFWDVLYPDDGEGLAAIPSLAIGGWGGWPHALGSAMLLQNAGGESIVVYCVLDSDYHSDKQKAARLDQARRNNVRLHIWSMKEIENYLLVPSAILRLVVERIAEGRVPPTEVAISDRIDDFARQRYAEVFDGISGELLSDDRALGAAGANRATRGILDKLWSDRSARIGLVSGKQLLSDISGWLQEHFGVSISASAVIRCMKPRDVHPEIRQLLDSVCAGLDIV